MPDVIVYNHSRSKETVVFSAESVKGLNFLSVLNGYLGDQTADVRRGALGDALALANDMDITVTCKL